MSVKIIDCQSVVYSSIWYVLYTKPRWEKKVYSTLLSCSIDAFLPQIKHVRQWSDRKMAVTVPLFPSYVFFTINDTSQLNEAVRVKGVLKILKHNNSPAKVTQTEINLIRNIVSDDEITEIKCDGWRPSRGDQVKIKDGPFQGFYCEILDVNNPNKVYVRIENLYSGITAVLPANYL